MPLPEVNQTGEHTGKSVSYYTVAVNNPTQNHTANRRYDPTMDSLGEDFSYVAECNDIIESLKMNYAEANVFKAIWRIAAARQGKLKKGNSLIYDAEKAVFFADRVLKQSKGESN